MNVNRPRPRTLVAAVSILVAAGAWGGNARAEVPTAEYMKMAAERAVEKNYLGAAFLYERVLARDTTQVDVLRKLGAAYRDMGASYPAYYDKAEEVYRRLERALGKDSPDMRMTWAKFYAAKWDFEPAINLMQGLLGDFPDSCDFWIKLGDYERLKGIVVREHEGIAAEEDQLAKAEQIYQRTLELCPDRLEPYRGMGVIYNQRKEYGKTTAMYGTLLEKHPDDVDLIRGWTVAEFSGRNWGEAAKGLKQLLEKDPRPEERLEYISVLKKLGREAEADSQAAIYKATAPKLYGPDPLLPLEVLREKLAVKDTMDTFGKLLDEKKYDEARELIERLKAKVVPLVKSDDADEAGAAQQLADWLDLRLAYVAEQKTKASP